MVISLSNKVPVVTDVVLTLAEALHGRRLTGDPRDLAVTHEPLVVDRSLMPPSTTAGFELVEGEVSLRVQLDEAWWNEHELANSSVLAQLVLGNGRRLSLWLAGDEPLHWSMSGLSTAEIDVVTRIVGVGPTP